MQQILRLKKGEESRIKFGHPWIYSNEVDTAQTPLKNFAPGEEAIVEAHDRTVLGRCYVNPHTLIAGRIFSKQAHQSLDQALILSRLCTALALRELLYPLPFYRLVFSEGDFLPGIVIDRYANDFVVQINTAGMEHRKAEIAGALSELFPNLNSVLLRNDTPARQREGLLTTVEPLLGDPPQIVCIEENQTLFEVPIWRGQKTGWFYDQRDNRQTIIPLCKQKRVLDVFSYLGGFGITAARHGAAAVTCLEASAFAADLIQKNAVLNQVSSQINIISSDAFSALRRLKMDETLYDVVVLDPPAFVKARKDRNAGSIAYQRINEMALHLLDDGGVLVSCSCSMHVSLEDLMVILKRAAYKTRKTLQVIMIGRQSADHPQLIDLPENAYLKMIVVKVMGE